MVMTAEEVGSLVPAKKPGRMDLVLCDECGCGMLTLEEAVAVAEVSSRGVYLQIEAGAVHFKETSERLPLICLKTLVAAARDARARP